MVNEPKFKKRHAYDAYVASAREVRGAKNAAKYLCICQIPKVPIFGYGIPQLPVVRKFRIIYCRLYLNSTNKFLGRGHCEGWRGEGVPGYR
eukprot:4658046-Pleurochrysis_carterae.AAC.1